MIDEYYKNFRVRDYMNEESLNSCLSTNIIDCSLGTNPFIEESMIKQYISEASSEINKYPSLQYELLKEEILKFGKEYLYDDINFVLDEDILKYEKVGFHPNINTATVIFNSKELHRIFECYDIKYKYMKI